MVVEVVLQQVLILEIATVFWQLWQLFHVEGAGCNLWEQIRVFFFDKALFGVAIPCPGGLVGPHDERLVKHIRVLAVHCTGLLQELLVINQHILGAAKRGVKLTVREWLWRGASGIIRRWLVAN